MSTATISLELTGRTLGRFEILRELGRGGMAIVYQARQTHLDRLVALKILLPQMAYDEGAVERFHREARSAARLDHPHIVTIFETGELELHPGMVLHFIAMQYIDGLTLKDMLQREGSLGLEQTTDLLEQVGRALDYAHRHGVIHRDLKPSNILIHREGTVYLGDFGLACGIDGTSGLTRTGVVIGTPEYMSPEQAEGKHTVSAASDMYALGIVAYEMLTGQVPFEGDTPMGMLVARLMHEPRPLHSLRADLPPAAAAVIGRALSREPAARFGTAAELVAALRDAEQQPAHTVVLPQQQPQPAPQSPPQPATGATIQVEQQAAIPAPGSEQPANPPALSAPSAPPNPASGMPAGPGWQRWINQVVWVLLGLGALWLLLPLLLRGGWRVLIIVLPILLAALALVWSIAQLVAGVRQARQTEQSGIQGQGKVILAGVVAGAFLLAAVATFVPFSNVRTLPPTEPPTPAPPTAVAPNPLGAEQFAAGKESFAAGNYSAAIEQYTAALAAGLDTANVHAALGDAYLYRANWDATSSAAAESDYAEAIRAYQQALNRNSRHTGALTGLGWVYQQRADDGDFLRSRQRFETSLTIDDAQPEAHHGLGWTLFTLQEYQDARKHFAAATRLDPQLADAYYGLGLSLEELDRPGDARAALQEALRLNPDDEEAQRALERLR